MIAEARARARAAGAPFAVLTFEPHPRSVFQPGTAPFRLTPFRDKARIMASFGVELLIAHHFDLAFAQKLVLAVDAKEGMIATRGWTETSSRRATDVATEVSDWPVAALLYTDVAKDGMLQGPNLQHTRELAEAGKVPVIASGGVGHIDHIRLLTQIPVWGVIVGRSLYEGTVDLRDAIRIAQGR